jgi:hypothetical protein
MARKTKKYSGTRKKKFRYITGTHSSDKCKNSPMKYRSSWELVVAKYLDFAEDVLSYTYESIKIPYVSNLKSSRVRYYIPDFIVTYKTGKSVIVEVKRKSAVDQHLVSKKAQFATYYAKNNNMEYEFWTEDEIKKLKKLLENKTK